MSPAVIADSETPSMRAWLTAFIFGSLLAAFVWRGLLTGGGLVGGDTYPYFFPQKQLLADAFANGEWPLWHDRTALGYPLHAESQAGVFYPTNQLLYRLLPINSAYNASIVLHYVFAFVFAWRFARCQTLSQPGALLAAMIFVYGWFPARLSLEWSIIGGVWFPLCLWMTERLMERRTWRRAAGLAVCFGVHLLAGHFTLAFITQLTCLAYAIVAAWRSLTSEGHALTQRPASKLKLAIAPGVVFGSIVLAMLFAAVQLVPTLELRQVSQRDGQSGKFNPGYGHMPPVYLTQLVASWWYWHSDDMVQTRAMMNYPWLMSAADTNQVEAHLYVGLIPLGLVCWLLSSRTRRQLIGSPWRAWLLLSCLAVVYSFGWLVPLFRELPGFGFFMGPGRYTIITTMGLSLIAGMVLDARTGRWRSLTRWSVAMLIFGMTLPDVLLSGQNPVCDAIILAEPPLTGLADSWVSKALRESDRRLPVRLLCDGANVGNLFGVSSVPQYLGLGPAEYFGDDFTLAAAQPSADTMFPNDEQLTRLQSLAVTHILTGLPATMLNPACRLVASGPDSFFNRAQARGASPCFLYELTETVARVSAEPSTALIKSEFITRRPGEVVVRVVTDDDCRIHLHDLMFPGWSVSVDDQPSLAERDRGLRRSVEVARGEHVIRWIYKPRSFWIGGAISLGSLITLMAMMLMRRNRRAAE